MVSAATTGTLKVRAGAAEETTVYKVIKARVARHEAGRGGHGDALIWRCQSVLSMLARRRVVRPEAQAVQIEPMVPVRSA